jgi:putative ABC transport system permease protein
MTIVGVVADTRRTGYDAAVRPETYLPHAQSPDSTLMLVVRTEGDPGALLPSLRAIVRGIDPGIAVQGGRPLESYLVEMTAQRRLNTLLLSVFGVVAALLATVGIYGVIAYSVEQRAKELSVRVALGASAGRILRLVVAYGVTATDPATFAAIAVVAALVAITACLVPAIRAVRVDPVQALKQS